MVGNNNKGYGWAVSAGLNAALAAISAKFFSYSLIRFGLVIFFNVVMWGCYVNSLKALSSLQATVTNFATNFLSSGLAGFFLFEEALPLQVKYRGKNTYRLVFARLHSFYRHLTLYVLTALEGSFMHKILQSNQKLQWQNNCVIAVKDNITVRSNCDLISVYEACLVQVSSSFAPDSKDNLKLLPMFVVAKVGPLSVMGLYCLLLV